MKVTGLSNRLGFPPAVLGERVVVTQACRLAGAAPDDARTALDICTETATRRDEQ